MAKAKRKFVCQQCGTVSNRWQGQCDDCGEWNSIIEEAAETVFSARHDLHSGGRALTLVGLDDKVELPPRTSTGISEFDRALGGGPSPSVVNMSRTEVALASCTGALPNPSRCARRRT